MPPTEEVTSVGVDRLQHQADLLSERCLLLVACTRARDGLYVSWAGGPVHILLTTGV